MAISPTLVYTIVLFLLIIGFVLWLVVMQIQEYYQQDDPKLKELLEKVRPLFEGDKYYSGILSELNTRNILKEITLYKGDKSYTINKQKVYLCLKDENNEYYNTNMLTYVLLHELSHVICDEIGHTEKFHDIFKEVLKEAKKLKIYDASIPIIKDYCQYQK